MRRRIGILVLLACFAFLGNLEAATVTIRVVAYNTYNNPDDAIEDVWFNTIFSAIGNELVNGVAKRLDILAVSETDTGSSTRLVDILNNLYGVSTYNVLTSSSVGGDRTGIVYDSNTLILLDSNDITDIGTRPILRAHFRPVGYASTTSEFYVYAIHLKSGSTTSDKTQRALEAANLRSNADALGEGKHIIYAGDFNLLGSSEAAWTNMLASGNGQAFDTADSPGEWRDNETFKPLRKYLFSGPSVDTYLERLAFKCKKQHAGRSFFSVGRSVFEVEIVATNFFGPSVTFHSDDQRAFSNPLTRCIVIADGPALELQRNRYSVPFRIGRRDPLSAIALTVWCAEGQVLLKKQLTVCQRHSDSALRLFGVFLVKNNTTELTD